ncbi:MAG TPA: hypothetical protein VKP13_09865 [Nitrospira sp.]|nr:hypothetical protein [Nitrospira sp.]
MKKPSRVYVLTVHPSSRSALRLWTGRSLHALRHCSSKQISQTLAEMQHSVDELHTSSRTPQPGASYSINRAR